MKFIQKTDPMAYLPSQEQIKSDIMLRVLNERQNVDFDKFSAFDVQKALDKDNLNTFSSTNGAYKVDNKSIINGTFLNI